MLSKVVFLIAFICPVVHPKDAVFATLAITVLLPPLKRGTKGDLMKTLP